MAVTANVPTAADFGRAPRALAPLKHYGLRLLKAHYMAPNHTATATELAGRAGYDEYTSVNRWYGEFAGQLCGELGVPHDFSVLLASALPGEPDGHLQLVLAPARGQPDSPNAEPFAAPDRGRIPPP